MLSASFEASPKIPATARPSSGTTLPGRSAARRIAAARPTWQSAPIAAGPADLRARLDDDVAAEHDRPVDLRVASIRQPVLGPDARRDLLAGDVDAHVPEHGVEDPVAQLVEVADVVPVRHRRVGVDRLAGGDEGGPERPRRSRTNVPAGCARGAPARSRRRRSSRGRSAPRRASASPGSRGCVVSRSRMTTPYVRRVVNRLHRQRRERAGAVVMAEERGHVDVVEAVARGDEDRLAAPEVLELLRAAAVPSSSGSYDQRMLHAERRAVAEVASGSSPAKAWRLTPTSRMSCRWRRFSRWWRTGRFADRHHRLRQEVGQRPEAGAEAGGHDHRLHRVASAARGGGSERLLRTAARCTPSSVTIAVTSSAGVTSKAGFRAANRSVTSRAVPLLDRDVAPRRRSSRSTVERRRDDVERDAVVRGEHGERVRADLVRGVAVGARCGRRRSRRASTSPRAISEPAAESAMTACGMPARSSSQAVSRAPWRSGRVSSTKTCSTSPRCERGPRPRRAPCRSRRSRAPPVLQCVSSPGRPANERRRVLGHAAAALDLVAVDLAGARRRGSPGSSPRAQLRRAPTGG